MVAGRKSGGGPELATIFAKCNENTKENLKEKIKESTQDFLYARTVTTTCFIIYNYNYKGKLFQTRPSIKVNVLCLCLKKKNVFFLKVVT